MRIFNLHNVLTTVQIDVSHLPLFMFYELTKKTWKLVKLHRSVGRSVVQSIYQSINLSTIKSINQPTNQFVKCSNRLASLSHLFFLFNCFPFHLFVHSFNHSFSHLFSHLFTQQFIYPAVNLFISFSFIYSLTSIV